MTLQELARRSGTRLVLPGRHPGGQIARVIAGDRMSDLLERAGPDTLLVTRLANPHLFRMAELMDVPGICLVRHPEPGPGLLEAACACGAGLLVASGELEETRAAMERCLGPTAAPTGPCPEARP
jgi:hypothetical protein